MTIREFHFSEQDIVLILERELVRVTPEIASVFAGKWEHEWRGKMGLDIKFTAWEPGNNTEGAECE